MMRAAIVALVALLPFTAMAQEEAAPAEAAPAEAAPAEAPKTDLEKADELYDKGGLKDIKASLPLYDKAAAANPKSYEAAWKATRAHRDYANKSMEWNVKNWKDVCKKHGKKALQHGEKATKLEPKKMEGHFWYGCAAGTYADGVSIITAISEGLADKTLVGFETAYKINKNYQDGGPILSLGRYWTVLPWPLADVKKGMKYLQEFRKAYPDNCEGQIYMVEGLLRRDDKGDEEEAKKILQTTRQCKEKFYARWAERIIKDKKF